MYKPQKFTKNPHQPVLVFNSSVEVNPQYSSKFLNKIYPLGVPATKQTGCKRFLSKFLGLIQTKHLGCNIIIQHL